VTLGPWDLLAYAGAMVLLFLTPGPVWVALTARALQGGLASAWPLAVGVALGDLLWPLLAVLGMGWLVAAYPGALDALEWVAAATFVLMGALVIRAASKPLGADSRLTRPGRGAGLAAGVAVILANPKAILFYAGMLPGFFDLRALTVPDVLAVLLISAGLPFAGNLLMAALVGRARVFLSSPRAVRRANLAAGALLIGAGVLLPAL
jgi:threonine/homoserine/homoserine lactone efflux protein